MWDYLNVQSFIAKPNTNVYKPFGDLVCLWRLARDIILFKNTVSDASPNPKGYKPFEDFICLWGNQIYDSTIPPQILTRNQNIIWIHTKSFYLERDPREASGPPMESMIDEHRSMANLMYLENRYMVSVYLSNFCHRCEFFLYLPSFP